MVFPPHAPVAGYLDPNPVRHQNQDLQQVFLSQVLIRMYLTLNGPCSVNSPKTELQPGPPFIHSTTGFAAGFLADSTNLEE